MIMRKLYMLLYTIFCFSYIQAQNWTTEMDSVLRVMSSDKLFHGQVLIAQNGQIHFHKAYGNQLKGDPLLKSTPMPIASVSKVFTALSVLMLEEQGKLKLTDLLTDHFPHLPYEVSLESMLNMTSGLPRFQPLIEKHWTPVVPPTTQDILKLVAEYKPEARVAGEAFAYNGDNYLLLAAIVEKVSGQPFASFVRDHIFKPLEMSGSYLLNPQQAIEGVTLSITSGPALGADHVYSTASDLYKFCEGLESNKLVSNKTLKKSFEFTALNDGTLNNYGFGWRLHREGEERETYVVGDGEEVRASIQRYLKARKVFIYLHNQSGSNWSGVYGAIRNIWQGKPYELPTKREVFPIDKSLYKNYVGQYLSEAFGLLHVSAENGRLYLRPDPVPGKEELVPSSATTFYFSGQALEWEFYLDENAAVIGLGLKGKPETMGKKQKD